MAIMRVALFTLGGTIASTHGPAPADDISAPAGRPPGVAPSLNGADLLAAVPGLNALGIELDVHDFLQVPGASVTIPDVIALAGAIRQQIAAGAAGAVVTQGTDTIEETAYCLDLLHGRAGPLVVTGAMRNPTLAGADGPANLLAAVVTAASPETRGLGCLVVLDDRIHAARRVIKTHSTSVSTFQSPDGGPLGYVVEGGVRLANRVERRPPIPAVPGRAPVVALHTAVLGDDGRFLASPADGLVIAGFGVGHVADSWLGPLSEVAARIPVVLASRTGSGPVTAGTYGYPGGERDLQNRGLIGAGFLHPYKARVLLHLALAAGAGDARIRAAFAHAGGLRREVPWPWPG
jgi:L-asparaginase